MIARSPDRVDTNRRAGLAGGRFGYCTEDERIVSLWESKMPVHHGASEDPQDVGGPDACRTLITTVIPGKITTYNVGWHTQSRVRGSRHRSGAALAA